MTRQPGKRPPPPPPAKAKAKATKVVAPPRGRVVTAPTRRTSTADLFASLDAIRAEQQKNPEASAQSKRDWSTWVRNLAAMLVINDDLERSVVSWHREHFADLIGLVSFQKWATADGWLRQREERITKFREAVERQIGTDNVRAFVDDLRKLDALHTDVADKLAGRGNTITVKRVTVGDDGKVTERVVDVDVIPTTFDKRSEAIAALVSLDRRRDEKRKGVLGGLPSALGTGATAPGLVVSATITLSPAVARAMAKAKLVAERVEVEGTGDEEGDDDE